MASCPECKKGYVLPGEPTGSMVDGAYFRSGPEDATKSQRAIVLLTDIFGLPLVNSKLIADELSKRLSCDVWVPDLFDGSAPCTVDELEPLLPHTPGVKITFMNKIRLFFFLITHLLDLYRVRSSVVDSRAHAFIEKIKAEKKYEKIGAVGYCFGGAIGIRLGSKDLFDSLVICHPGSCNIEQIKAIKVPTSWVCAQEDTAFPEKLRNEAEALFASRKDKPDFIDYEFNDYKGTTHGFAARPNLEIPEIVDAYKGALDQVSTWFERTL